MKMATSCRALAMSTPACTAAFTYIWIAEGRLHVAAAIDPFSRRVVGCSMKAEMTAQIVT